MPIFTNGNLEDGLSMMGRTSSADGVLKLIDFLLRNVPNFICSIMPTYTFIMFDENYELHDEFKDNPSRDINLEIPNDSIIIDGICGIDIRWM